MCQTSPTASSGQQTKTRRGKRAGKSANNAGNTAAPTTTTQAQQLPGTSVTVDQLFNMHCKKDNKPTAVKKQTPNGKSRVHAAPIASPTPRHQHVKPQGTPPVARHMHHSYSTPNHYAVRRQMSSSPPAYATPAYADSPNPDEVPMPPMMWMTKPGTPTRMTGNQLMRHLTAGIVN